MLIPSLLYIALLSTSSFHVPRIEADTFHQPVSHHAARYHIIIDKSDFELTVYEDGEWVTRYPVVFGNKDQGDKQMEGDRRTPEGQFKIIQKKYHKEWGYFLLLDYPNQESLEKFHQRKKAGLIPKQARVGGGIGIHGTRRHEEYAVDRYMNWTEGCVSVKYSDIFELYTSLPLGTSVEIRK